MISGIACTKEIHHVKGQEIRDGKYDMEYPAKPANDALNSILSRVKLLSTIAFYESYEFDPAAGVKLSDIDDDVIEEKSNGKFHFNQPATGTATVIYSQNRRVGLLTCAHIVHFPDTIINYQQDMDGRDTEIVKNIAFKIRQNINIIDFKLGGDFRILAMDMKHDVALIGKEMHPEIAMIVPPLKYPLGNSRELDWATFVYVIGYPRGEKMITKAIVSQPPGEKNDTFVIDAVFNRGFSGGIVLALRDGMPNFELVGMAKSVPAETKLYLAPEKSYDILQATPDGSYGGDAHVQTHENIYYGITYVVTAEIISNFISKNANVLKGAGYQISQFFPVK